MFAQAGIGNTATIQKLRKTSDTQASHLPLCGGAAFAS